MYTMEEFVLEKHILRKIERSIDFNFIYDIVKPNYCLDNGRISIDPVVLFKIILFQIVFGIKSKRSQMTSLFKYHSI